MTKRNIFTTATFGITAFALVAGTTVWLTVINPQLASLNAVVKKRNENVTALSAAQRKQALLGPAQEQYETIKRDLERTTFAIPEGSSTGEFVAALERMASDTGVSIGALSSTVQAKVAPAKAPAPSKTADADKAKTAAAAKPKTLEDELRSKYNSTVFEVRLTGGYESIRAFIDRLRTLDRFNVLSSITLSSAPDTGIITASLAINIYHKEAAKAK